MDKQLEPYISARQAAREVRMRDAVMVELLRSGAVPTAYETPGGQLRVQRSGLRQFMRSGLRQWMSNRSDNRRQPVA